MRLLSMPQLLPGVVAGVRVVDAGAVGVGIIRNVDSVGDATTRVGQGPVFVVTVIAFHGGTIIGAVDVIGDGFCKYILTLRAQH